MYVSVAAGNGFNKWAIFRSLRKFEEPTNDV
jgi:hypothetical protein